MKMLLLIFSLAVICSPKFSYGSYNLHDEFDTFFNNFPHIDQRRLDLIDQFPEYPDIDDLQVLNSQLSYSRDWDQVVPPAKKIKKRKREEDNSELNNTSRPLKKARKGMTSLENWEYLNHRLFPKGLKTFLLKNQYKRLKMYETIQIGEKTIILNERYKSALNGFIFGTRKERVRKLFERFLKLLDEDPNAISWDNIKIAKKIKREYSIGTTRGYISFFKQLF